MRKIILLSIVFVLGLGGAFLALSPRAGAHSLNSGTFTGSVGTSGSPDAFVIALNTGSSVAPGTYTFNITDYSSIHNFDLCKGSSCTGSNSVNKTGIAGTGSVSWEVALTPGVYTYQCDAHSADLQGQFTVTGGTTTTPPPAVTASFTKIVAKRSLVTVTTKANQKVKFTGWVLKGGKAVGTATTTTNVASTILKIKPVPTLKAGYITVQVRAQQSATNFKVIRKKVYVY